MGSCADPAVELAFERGRAATTAPSSVCLTSARGVGMVVVATIGIAIASFQDVSRALEHGELGTAKAELDIELSNSDSCGGFCSTHLLALLAISRLTRSRPVRRWYL